MSRRRPAPLVLFVLLLAPAIDELCSAGPTVPAPDIRVDLALSVTGLFAFGTVIPVIAAMLVEPAIVWMASGPRRRAVLLASAGAWSAGFLLAASAPNAGVLAAGLATTFVAGGVALAVARAGLVAASPDIERSLARWTLSASIGDLAGPLALAALAWAGGGWRAGLAACGLAVAVWALGALAAPVGHPEEDEDDGTASVWEALRDGRLAAWLLAVALCSPLDELFVAATALWGAEAHGVGLSGAGLLVAADMLGGVVGLTVFERMGAPRHWLVPACAVSLLGLVGVVLAPGPLGMAAALFVCGLGAGPHYPLALAGAHRALPGRPERVEALGDALVGLELVWPLAFGLLADGLGLGVAVLALAVQPVGIAAIAWGFPARSRVA